jgi:hypothetical protein
MAKPDLPPDMTREEMRLAQIMRNVVDERIGKAVDRFWNYFYILAVIAVGVWWVSKQFWGH